ncbi:hypothetical protein CcCBS67573_g03007 [Chytriomyces confervae]|uniref:R3H domain-containing protein n=1 Tax=Chytriomyces confervae TaxID=246404 RepID=A0A507FJ77_9FUNG|nr:hypothetical protein CcCBS67573_g03007 [Chytriomyces confervae]
MRESEAHLLAYMYANLSCRAVFGGVYCAMWAETEMRSRLHWLLDKENGALGTCPSPVDVDGDLWCNAECEAMAKPENRTVFYTPELVEYAEKHLEFTQLITTAFSNLLQASHKFHTFAPMKLIQRDFIEALAQHYGIPTETEGEDPEAIIVAQRVLASTRLETFLFPVQQLSNQKLFKHRRPAILLTTAIDLKKRGLLLYGVKEEDVDQPPINDSSVERRPKLTKGFARPMAVPVKETIKLSNAFDLLQQGNE